MKSAEGMVLTFLINALWQAPLVFLLAAASSRLLERAPARFRHILWMLALAASLALPLASVISTSRRIAASTPAAPSLPATAPAGPPPLGPFDLSWLRALAGGDSEPARTHAWPEGVAGAVSGAYALLLLAASVRLFASWRATGRLARRATVPALTPDLEAIVARCRAAFGLADLPLLSSTEVASPVTFGALQPTIVVPPGFFASTSRTEQIAALGHEMAHIARRDYPLNVLAEILLLPLVFHPATVFLRRRLAEAREMACDEATIERLLSARSYARSLLALAATFAGLPRPTQTLGVFDAGTLEVRMQRMTDATPRMGAPRARIHLTLVLLVLAAAGIAASGLAVKAVAGEIEAGTGAQARSAALAGPAEVTPFLGKWIGTIPVEGVASADRTHPAKEEKEPAHFADLEVRWVDGAPLATLTLMKLARVGDRVEAQPDKPRVAVRTKVQGTSLLFRTHSEAMRTPEGRFTPVDVDWNLELTGPGRGSLRMIWNSYFTPARARGEQVPPPPPPLEMRRQS